LLSRCQVYVLKNLEKEHLVKLLGRALLQDVILKKQKVKIKEDQALLRFSGGDARKLLNILELIVTTENEENNKAEIEITDDKVVQKLQQNMAVYDKQGEQHYDIISAFIKSMRGSDPNASVYWLARMIAGGEDPKFIARRMIILAAEDIGLANPNALLMATQCFEAIRVIGMPEGRIILSETAIYLATSPKSNSAYLAIDEALALVKKTGDLPVPLAIRNAPTKLMKDLGYGKEYQYAHAYQGSFADQEFLPEEISNTKIFNPGENSREKEITKWLSSRWKKKYNY